MYRFPCVHIHTNTLANTDSLRPQRVRDASARDVDANDADIGGGSARAAARRTAVVQQQRARSVRFGLVVCCEHVRVCVSGCRLRIHRTQSSASSSPRSVVRRINTGSRTHAPPHETAEISSVGRRCAPQFVLCCAVHACAETAKLRCIFSACVRVRGCVSARCQVPQSAKCVRCAKLGILGSGSSAQPNQQQPNGLAASGERKIRTASSKRLVFDVRVRLLVADIETNRTHTHTTQKKLEQ